MRLLAESMAQERLLQDVQKKNEEEVLREVQGVVKMLARKNMEKDARLQGFSQNENARRDVPNLPIGKKRSDSHDGQQKRCSSDRKPLVENRDMRAN